jgi:leucyl-tRNA synthetase
MHVGHVRNYTISDVIARFDRMQGFNVLHPMGWDAFGLPAENYAIKTGISPKVTVADSTKKFKQQLTQMGISFDWSREFSSADPSYYKWTQYFFTLLFERGLAYQKVSPQWWCETDKTVLANEQVEAGRCWRCGNEVTKKPLKQWFFKITDYADRLLDDLEDLDWSDAIKSMQRNWIGRSKGAEITFEVVDRPQAHLTIFTTRPDTLYGATFVVLAPEHPLVQQLTTSEYGEALADYKKVAQAKSEIDRMETDREKTGVFTGSYALNPVNGEQIPIWVADYVLMGYGTGAIMAVPAHDERDFTFAEKFKLPIVAVIEPETGTPQQNPEFRRSIVAIVRNPKTGKYLSVNWGSQGGNLFIGGGREENEAVIETAEREIKEETGYKHLKFIKQTGKIHHNYFAHSKNVARYIQAHALLFELIDDAQDQPQLEVDEQGKFTLEWLTEAEIESKVLDELHATSYGLLIKGYCYGGEGRMINSGPYDGQSSAEVRETLVAKLASQGQGHEKVTFRIRDWLISRQRYWGAPIPIVHCPTDGAVPVPQDQLPVVLPDVTDYQPSGNGQSPLARVTDWVETTCPRCGGPAKRETDTMDGFACSSWYFLRFADPHNSQAPFAAEKAKAWLPVNVYVGGAEHAVMHLLYARFWTKVMADAGLIEFTEPFTALRNHGMILAPDGRKMSKSWGNVIAPEQLIQEGYGADSIRVMELFIGPWNQSANWSVEGMGGCFRFLQRAWNISQQYFEGENGPLNEMQEKRLLRNAHKTIKKISKDMQHMGFNTAIAALMEFVNELYKTHHDYPAHTNSAGWKVAITGLIQLLAPFAPHLSEELWQQTGQLQSVHISQWPTWEEQYLKEDSLTIVVQVNGKLKATLQVPSTAAQDQITTLALQSERIAPLIEGKKPKRIVYVPGRLLNIVL